MPAPLLPQKKVEQLLRQGLGPKAIADRLLAEDYIEVSPEAISMFRRRRGIPRLKARYEDLLPWRVLPEHANRHPAKMLRLEGQRRAGVDLTEERAAELERWKRKLADEDCVIHYQPDTVVGWFVVPRRHGIDEDLIRIPD